MSACLGMGPCGPQRRPLLTNSAEGAALHQTALPTAQPTGIFMKLPTTIRYVIRMLLELNGAEKPVAANVLAEKIGVSHRVIENAQSVLKQNGYTSGTVGARGGISLARPLREISLGGLLALFDEQVEFTICQGEKSNDCPNLPRCTTRASWQNVSAKIQADLETYSLDALSHEAGAEAPLMPTEKGLCEIMAEGRAFSRHPVMRRKDRLLPSEDCIRVLEQGEYGILALVDQLVRPYAVPLSYVWFEESIYFHSAQEGFKVSLLKSSPDACFTVVGKVQAVFDKGFSTNYESVMVFGDARQVTDDEEKHAALMALAAKYQPDHLHEADAYIKRHWKVTDVYAVRSVSVTGKARR